MEDALNIAAQHFSPQIAMALVGGLLGGLIMYDSNKKDYGNRLARLLLVTSIVLAGACSDYLLTKHKVISLFIQMAGGMFAGVGGSCLMDAFRVFSPKLFTKLVTNVGNAAVDGVTLVVKKRTGQDEH